ncbi:hypothetical protein KUTeg_021595 [Tegillarca granosa]|uniref:Serine protease n=1 Tax=Tegillarca granosa TaxID=220873 RepID=A0ABQ9E6M9_TEGGR|nr:hypothetical protein KUTeg_021595 [Tegillarca granosa]
MINRSGRSVPFSSSYIPEMGNCVSCCRKKGKSKEKYISDGDNGDTITQNKSQGDVDTKDKNELPTITETKDQPEKKDIKDDKPPQLNEKQTTPKVEPKADKRNDPKGQRSKDKQKKQVESESNDSSSSSDREYGKYKRVYINQNDNSRKNKKSKDTKKKSTKGNNKEATQSIGMIHMDNYQYGTGFRVGSKYVMTAYHIVRKIIDPQKSGNFCVTRLAHQSIWIVFKYKSRNEVFDEKYKPLRFKFKPELIYTNEDLDTAILTLQEDEKEFPKPVQNFAEIDESKHTYLLGHPDGNPLRYDPKIELVSLDEKIFESAKKWSLKNYHEDGYEGITDRRKILFHTSFQHGGSGSPGVMLTSHDKVTVVLMLLKGFPSFYFNKFDEKEKKLFIETRGESFLMEQGISMKSIWLSMKDNYAKLCEDIFPNNCFNA